MASIVSQIVMVWVNRELSDGPVNWPHVSRRNRQNSSLLAKVGGAVIGDFQK